MFIHPSWTKFGPDKHGFWANVNSDVAHARWSQTSECLFGSGEKVSPQIHNGYGPFAAQLYSDKTNKKLFM